MSELLDHVFFVCSCHVCVLACTRAPVCDPKCEKTLSVVAVTVMWGAGLDIPCFVVCRCSCVYCPISQSISLLPDGGFLGSGVATTTVVGEGLFPMERDTGMLSVLPEGEDLLAFLSLPGAGDSGSPERKRGSTSPHLTGDGDGEQGKEQGEGAEWVERKREKCQEKDGEGSSPSDSNSRKSRKELRQLAALRKKAMQEERAREGARQGTVSSSASSSNSSSSATTSQQQQQQQQQQTNGRRGGWSDRHHRNEKSAGSSQSTGGDRGKRTTTPLVQLSKSLAFVLRCVSHSSGVIALWSGCIAEGLVHFRVEGGMLWCFSCERTGVVFFLCLHPLVCEGTKPQQCSGCVHSLQTWSCQIGYPHASRWICRC